MVVRRELGDTAQVDDRGAPGSPQRQQHPEVAVGGHHHQRVGHCSVEDLVVAGGNEAKIRNMDGVEPGGSELLGEAGCQVRVQEELHALATGTSRSFTAAAAYSSAASTSARSR